MNWTFAYEKNNLKYHLTHFAGYKFALFNYATNSLGGYVDFDYFRVDDKITGAGETENINVELGSPEAVAGVPNKEYTVPVTMDSVPAGSERSKRYLRYRKILSFQKWYSEAEFRIKQSMR